MLINLIGAVLIHPYVDQAHLSILTRDTRPKGSVSALHDGLVYEERSRTKHIVVEDFIQTLDGLVRTSMPLHLAEGKNFVCAHQWELNGGIQYPRILRIKMVEGIVYLDEDHSKLIAIDTSVSLELKDPTKTTVWDHLTTE